MQVRKDLSIAIRPFLPAPTDTAEMQIASCGLGRVNRVNFRGTLVNVTFGTAQLDQPLSIAAPHHSGNAEFS